MQNNGFKKSLLGLDSKSVFSYLDTLAKDLERKLRSKDDDIRNLKKELSETKAALNNYKSELEKLEETSSKEIEHLKITAHNEMGKFKAESENKYNILLEKYNAIYDEYTNDKEKISAAILMSERTGNEIIEKATQKAAEILTDSTKKADRLINEAKVKADIEKEKYRKSKADVSDFTYDIKKLLDKLTEDIKDKIE